MKIKQHLSHRARHSFVIVAVLISLFSTLLPIHADTTSQSVPLTSRHPDAGIWVMYTGSNTYVDLQKPYIKGAMAYARWNNTYTGPNTFNWYSLDKSLDNIINKAGKKAMIDVTVGYCPTLEWPKWMRDRVASRKEKNSMGCQPLQFWDPVYIDMHKAYIRAVATHLADFDSHDSRPGTTDVTFVRAEVMAETMENLPNDDQLLKWEWQDFNPAPNGRIYKVNLTKTIKYDYHELIVHTYEEELQRAYSAVGLPPPAASAKAASYWEMHPSADQFVAEKIWFDEHSSSPSPKGWYYDMYTMVKSGKTRGTSEAGAKTPPSFFAQYMYWEILANLHYGVEFIGVYGTNKYDPALQPKGAVGYAENREALEFATRYAGHYRNPATSPGAWIALRGGYPEDNFGGRIYAKRMWTNYEFLMTQYRPQDSVVLYSSDYPVSDQETVMPIVKRLTKQPWVDEVPLCNNTLPSVLCGYIPSQQPNTYIRLANGYHEYTYNKSNLGKVTYCGTNMFCVQSSGVTRSEQILWARRTNANGGSPFMRFNLDDTFAQSLGGRATVRIVYLDQGTGKWQLRYDSTSGAEKSAITIQKGNTNQWKEVLVDLQDVAFQNRQEGGSDVSLYNMGDDDDTFHLIEVGRFGTVPTTASEEPAGEGDPIPPDEDPAEILPPDQEPPDQLTPYNNELRMPFVQR